MINTDYKKFIRSFLIVAIGLLIVDSVFGFIVDKLTVNLPDDGGYEVAKEKRLLRNLKDEDVVIIGSSRATYHFVSSTLQDSIGNYLNKDFIVYNGDLNRRLLDCSCLLLENIVKNSKDKLIILETSNECLYDNSFATIQYFAPFYHNSEIVKQYIDNLGLKTRIEMKSSLYRYNFNVTFFKMLLGFVTKYPSIDGYLPLFGEMQVTTPHMNKTIAKTPEKAINNYIYTSFVRVMDLCKKEKVNIVVVSSPHYYNERDTYYEKQNIIGKVCKEKNIPYFNMIDEPYFELHPELFHDPVHLNDKGAKIFTSIFFERLKPYLNSWLASTDK